MPRNEVDYDEDEGSEEDEGFEEEFEEDGALE